MNGNGLMETDRRPLARFAFLAGALSILVLVLLALPVPRTAAEQLAFVRGHYSAYVLFELAVLVWPIVSIPFVVGLGGVLRPPGNSVALTAIILTTGGILLLGFATYASTGALLAISAAGNPPTAGADTYQVTVWTQLGYLLTDPPLMAWGVGQLLFGWLAWKGDVLPNWLAVIGAVGGFASFLASWNTPAAATVLAPIAFASFALWEGATGVVLLRARTRVVDGAAIGTAP